MYGEATAPPPPPAHAKKVARTASAQLLRELSGDEDDIQESIIQTPNVLKPWLPEFECYLDTNDPVPEGTSVLKWWGVSVIMFLFLAIVH